MELPQTLHGQLYLLAYDKKRRQFQFDCNSGWNKQWRFEFALRSAMLTDLHLTGYIEDRNGEACRLKTRHDDPVLNDMLNRAAGQGWSQLVSSGNRTCQDVHHQLAAVGWIHGQRRRMVGIVPARFEVYDDDLVGGLAHRVTDTLRDILENRAVEPRSLAVGLIAVQAQLAVVSAFTGHANHRDRLREMTLAAIEPILGLYQAIHIRYSSRMGGGGGGCGGGGCGGGI
ncbi:GPP34 family phosphoprotein [Mycolicibacterium stellerae]|uniref:GPP34 family phosphoprotein n=1 Tax=Mycolicibacterium stellerae TaxID=2358193 RepID=UPI0013DD9F58|nr:GPP34 family phosphoprotein [Mycolicibacterium stellerae]